jgi:hypothetical protein
MANTDFDPNEHPIRANRGIVIVVAALGALIVLGVGILIYGVSTQTGKRQAEPTELAVEEAPGVSGRTVSASPPLGSVSVLSMTADGGRLYLLVRKSNGESVIRALDATGALIYEVPVTE